MRRFVLAWSMATLFSAVGTAVAADAPATETFSAEQLAAATALRDQASLGSGAYAIVESLTTEVGQRMAGSAADARAVAWAEAKFRALGFDRIILQPVRFPIWIRGHESAEVVSPAPQTFTITALGWSSATPADGVSAEVVGFANLEALKAADAEQVRGRIAYVSHAMDRRRDGGGYSKAVEVRGSGAEIASNKGALALLIRSVGTDSHRLPHTGTGISFSQIPNQPEVLKRAIKASDGSLVALTAVPAAALSVPDADQVERLLKLDKPLVVRLKIEARIGAEYTSHNVIGEVTGRELPDEYVVVGGHLDSWDLGTGAIDDGAGVAITMAAGALIAKSPMRPRRSVRVVAFANEEQGIFGGRAYAQRSDASAHVAAAESDFGAGRIYRFDTQVDPSQLPAIKQIMQVLHPLGIEAGGNEARGGADVGGLLKHGVPMFELRQDGSDYFDLHHTADDTLDKIDPAALDQNVAAYAAFVWLTADAMPAFRAPTVAP